MTKMTRSLATHAVRVRALIDGGVSMITRSYSSSIRASISSSFQTSETVGAGLSSKSDLGLPTSTSSFEPLDQGRGHQRPSQDRKLWALKHLCYRRGHVRRRCQPAGRIALRVKVNHQSVDALIESCRCQAKGYRSFSYATLEGTHAKYMHCNRLPSY